MSGKATRTLLGVLVGAVLVGLVVFCALAGGDRRHHRDLPRGPYPSLGSCPVFPPANVPAGTPSLPTESAWNQDISQAPVDPNSNAYMAYIAAHGGNRLVPYFGSERRSGFPYQVVGDHQRRFRIHWVGQAISRGSRAPIPAGALIEAGQTDGGDRHVITIDRSRCKLFELFRAFFHHGRRPHWNSDGGMIWNLRSPVPFAGGQGAADASGLPMFAGLVRYDEVATGAIHHAFRVSLTGTGHARILPALSCAGLTNNPNAPPMGLRLRLKASFDISKLSGQARVIAEALKHYGLIVSDNGENWFFSGTSDRRWDDPNLRQLYEQIPGSAFEVVKSATPPLPC